MNNADKMVEVTKAFGLKSLEMKLKTPEVHGVLVYLVESWIRINSQLTPDMDFGDHLAQFVKGVREMHQHIKDEGAVK